MKIELQNLNVIVQRIRDSEEALRSLRLAKTTEVFEAVTALLRQIEVDFPEVAFSAHPGSEDGHDYYEVSEDDVCYPGDDERQAAFYAAGHALESVRGDFDYESVRRPSGWTLRLLHNGEEIASATEGSYSSADSALNERTRDFFQELCSGQNHEQRHDHGWNPCYGLDKLPDGFEITKEERPPPAPQR